jgi:hypothetical protein
MYRQNAHNVESYPHVSVCFQDSDSIERSRYPDGVVLSTCNILIHDPGEPVLSGYQERPVQETCERLRAWCLRTQP